MRLYFYSADGFSQYEYNSNTAVVSEEKLPTRQKGKCTLGFPNIESEMEIGEVADVALVDPIILEKAKRLSLEENPPPETIKSLGNKRYQFDKGRYKVVFLWKGKRVWVYKGHSCLASHVR